MNSIANIIIKVAHDVPAQANGALEGILEDEVKVLLEDRVLTRAADSVPTSQITSVEEVWLDGPHGGPFPTMKQGDTVKRLREENGRESLLLFSADAYEGTHLHAYGLIQMIWDDADALRGGVAQIRPDGTALTFEPLEI
jgi:hypothetical protein